MKYRIDYQHTHDIDWFGRYRYFPIHVASNGGKVPDEIEKKHNNELLSQIYAEDEFLSGEEIEVNREGIRELLKQQYSQLQEFTRNKDNIFHVEVTNETIDNYAVSFIKMAKRGFISMDRYDYAHFDNSECLLIAYPKLTKKVFRYWKEHEELYKKLPQVNIRVVDKY